MIYVDPKYRVHPTVWTNVGVPYVTPSALTQMHLFKQDVVTDSGDDPMTDEQVEETTAKLASALQETGAEYDQRARQSRENGGHMVTTDDFAEKRAAADPTRPESVENDSPDDPEEIVIDDSPINF